MGVPTMTRENDIDIFGAVRMGYLVVGSRKISEWKRFGTEAIGLHLAFESATELAFRMDQHARRLIVENDVCEDILAVGWQLDDDSVLAVVLDRLTGKGVKVDFIDDERAQRRGVTAYYRFIGPRGLPIEFFIQPSLDKSPLDMLSGGFITGGGGMGHISIMSREPERSIAFWQELLDARTSDIISLTRGEKVVIDVSFLRVNERHHSVAIAATRGTRIDFYDKQIQHLNLEAATLDDLSSAYERCKALGYKLARGVGQHPNDKELSFYVVTPSGFDLEVGWDALTVNEANWPEGVTYPNMSTWGHDIPGRFSSELSFGQLIQGLRSLMKKEYLPW